MLRIMLPVSVPVSTHIVYVVPIHIVDVRFVVVAYIIIVDVDVYVVAAPTASPAPAAPVSSTDGNANAESNGNTRRAADQSGWNQRNPERNPRRTGSRQLQPSAAVRVYSSL